MEVQDEKNYIALDGTVVDPSKTAELAYLETRAIKLIYQ